VPDVDVSIREVGGQAVIVLRGELDLAATPGTASHLIAAVAACGPSVIVDLAALESLGYGGLGVLVRVLKWTREGGGEMSLAAPQQQVRRVLDVTGLIDIFPVFPSVEQAQSSARRSLARPPAALRPSRAATAIRPGRHLAYCAACRPPAWRLPGCRTCRPRPMRRDACRTWRRGNSGP
jgi:anti-sigma B factor antagonist